MSYWLERDIAGDDALVASGVAYFHVHDDGTAPHRTAITILQPGDVSLHVPGQYDRAINVRCLDCRRELESDQRIMLWGMRNYVH